MSLGDLPSLPAKPRLTTGTCLVERGCGDYLPLLIDSQSAQDEPKFKSFSVKEQADISRLPQSLEEQKRRVAKAEGVIGPVSPLVCADKDNDKEENEEGEGGFGEFTRRDSYKRTTAIADKENLITQKPELGESDSEPLHERSKDMVHSTKDDLCVSSLDHSSKYWRGQVTILESHELGILPQEFQVKVNPRQDHTNLDTTMNASPITRAILRRENSLVLESLKQGENPNLVCSKTGQSYLHIISWHATNDKETAWVPMVYQLSNAGADLNHCDKSGCTAARIAVRRKLTQVLAAMLKCGAELGAVELEEAESVKSVARTEMLEVVRRFTPGYWEAVLDPNSFKVSRLVKAWARINISRHGKTLIEFAKQNARDMGSVQLLLQHEASNELAHAVMAGDCDRARVLLCDGGADLCTADFSVRTATQNTVIPLSLTGAAEKYGHHKVLKLLQAKGAPITRSPPSSYSPAREAKETWHQCDGSIKEDPFIPVHQGRGVEAPTSALCAIL
ncbi:ankyrin-1-like [Plakobranchus ocellatus]|uniref:Ankyrin-1-like n=1 Tax=Plakobranchus ocellatus TaxID=259542 RepID=A0AAV3YQE0_9GAST|nr:ankyrin-1-like [Plakobranchus ocellatus]